MRDILFSDARSGPPKRGEDIPLPARVTALADVFDSFSSRRVCKEAWNEQRVFNLISEERGKHFDPEVVDAFFQIKDVIRPAALFHSSIIPRVSQVLALLDQHATPAPNVFPSE